MAFIFSAERINDGSGYDSNARVGAPFPGNPLNDRAKGYLLKGVIKNAVSNYGNFITWDEHPAGLWGEYAYLPHIGFIAGVPGNNNTSNFSF